MQCNRESEAERVEELFETGDRWVALSGEHPVNVDAIQLARPCDLGDIARVEHIL